MATNARCPDTNLSEHRKNEYLYPRFILDMSVVSLDWDLYPPVALLIS